MTAIFQLFKPLLIPLEGDELTDTTDDHGGLTRYGISQVAHPEVDVANLTLDGAFDWYEQNYWDHYQLSRIGSQDIANKLMSLLINMNPATAIRCLQRAIVHCSGTVLVDDGLLGEDTIRMLNALDPNWILDRFRIEGALFYISRVKADPSQLKFLRGWCNRALG